MNQVKQALDGVRTSGEAYAAIDTATSFARDAATAIRSGGSWFSSDAWRTSAASDLSNQADQVGRLRGSYSDDSTTPVGDDWKNVHRDKVSYLYNLAEVSRQSYPADTDTNDLDFVLAVATTDLFSAVANAPKLIVSKGGEVISSLIDTAVSTGTKAVKGAAALVQEAAAGISDAAESIIPWKVVGAAALIVGGLIVGLYYLGKSGTLKVKVP